ncbi:MAG: PIG-L deacetylase family protein [Chloroflexota bacterium]
MFWAYLSPHFDDVALSCGGLAWQQSQLDECVHLWTVCAADPPRGGFSPFAEQLHARWETGCDAVAARRSEDIASCAILGASYRHFSIPDCIYRTDANGVHLYASEAALFSAVHPAEDGLIEQMVAEIEALLPEGANLVGPMGIGRHVDHRLTRAIAEGLAVRRVDVALWFYADFPYVLTQPEQLRRLCHPQWESVRFDLPEAAVRAWVSGFVAHSSQLSTFWPDADTAEAVFAAYTQLAGGARLWRVV